MPPPSPADCTKLFPRDKDRTRFMKFVVQEPPPTLCWRWIGAVSGRYPIFDYQGEQVSAARWAYRSDPKTDPIPLDRRMLRRRCKNPMCVNPAHLDPMNDKENSDLGLSPSAENARKKFCSRGHRFTPENTVYDKGRRRCRTCRRQLQLHSARRRTMQTPCRDCGELSSKGICRSCLSERARTRREERIAERRAARVAVLAALGELADGTSKVKRIRIPIIQCPRHLVNRVRDDSGALRCPECWREYQARKREKLSPNRYKDRQAKGLCVTCGRPRESRLYRCDACHEKHNIASRALRAKRAAAAALAQQQTQAREQG